MLHLRVASSPADYQIASQLFREYANSLEVDLCFQGFEQELLTIAQQYAPPSGALLLAVLDDEVVGCTAVRLYQPGIAELKRMYVQPGSRRQGISKQLLLQALQQAASLGYHSIRLDSLPSMQPAIALYRAHGFEDIPPYRDNPVEGTVYLEKRLR